MVHLRIHSVLCELTGSAENYIDNGRAMSVGDVLRQGLSERAVLRIIDETGRIREHINIFVDGVSVRKSAGLDTPVPEGAVIDVFPSVSGG